MLTAEMLKPALALRGEPASSFEPLGGKLEVYSTSSSPALQLRCEFLGTHGVIGAWRPFPPRGRAARVKITSPAIPRPMV
jgi:hypothetical protein